MEPVVSRGRLSKDPQRFSFGYGLGYLYGNSFAAGIGFGYGDSFGNSLGFGMGGGSGIGFSTGKSLRPLRGYPRYRVCL